MCSVSTPSAPPPPKPLPPPSEASGVEFGGVSMRQRQLSRGRDALRAGGIRKQTDPYKAPVSDKRVINPRSIIGLTLHAVQLAKRGDASGTGTARTGRTVTRDTTDRRRADGGSSRVSGRATGPRIKSDPNVGTRTRNGVTL